MKYDKPEMEFDNSRWSLTKESVGECGGNERFMGVIDEYLLYSAKGALALISS